MDWERTTATPVVPVIACSIGVVTRTSTCSGARPDASVWISTCGGANSGNTSYRVRLATTTP